VEAVPRSRTLLLLNFRPEYQASWMTDTSHRRLPLHPLSPAAAAALLAELLGTDASLAGLAERIATHTRGNPFFIEELIRGLVEAVPRSRTLLLLNFRPEYQASWMTDTSHRRLPLHPLSPAAAAALLAELLGTDASLAGLAERIATHTRGNPFFIEELIRGLV